MERADATELERVLVARSAVPGEPARPHLEATPLLAALGRAGTRHVYGNTADVEELRGLLTSRRGVIRREVDGNTANQPLVRKVLERELDAVDPRAWARELVRQRPELSRPELLRLLYACLLCRVGNAMVRDLGAERCFDVSLQLHMGLAADAAAARWTGRLLRRVVPSALVKVHVFMGRLDQGLQAERLGEPVVLEAQRALVALRAQDGLWTRLIVASMREWRSSARLAGCDAFTAPCDVLNAFPQQDELALSKRVRSDPGPERVARLSRVEPGFLAFLRELRGARDYPQLRDGEELYKRFDRAGFGDFFHAPTPSEREELARGKLPDLDGSLVKRIPLDTHFSLLANLTRPRGYSSRKRSRSSLTRPSAQIA